jgi:hypothetical protein
MKPAYPAWRGLLLLVLLIAVPVRAAQVLFVVGNTTLTAGDSRVKSLLESKGHVLTLKTGQAATTADATGKALVVISSTVPSADVNTKFRTVAVPVIVWESHILDDMGMTNGQSFVDYGTVSPVTQVQINLPSHQMAAGFNGGVAVFDAQATACWGKVGANALKVATHTSEFDKAHIFGYEGGVAMFGLNAPARRVGFFFDDMSPSVLSGNGEVLFHAAVNWALSVSAPVITAQPVSTSVNAGQTAAFSVTATGGALSYQWRKNGQDINGANASSYTTPATAAADNGALYSVLITNTAGSVTSANAVLTVGNSQPVIATHPKNQAVEENQKVTFVVEAAGTAPLSYQWKKGTAFLPGATSSTYVLPTASLEDHGATFTCVVTNAAGSATSQAATLLVVASPYHAQTQYFETLNSQSPSFRLAWRNDQGNRYAYFEEGGLERLRLQDDYVQVPNRLNFGPDGRLGIRWTHDAAQNFDYLALGTGNDGTPQFDVLKVRRTPNGVDGVEFPMGLDFPIREVVDGALTWMINGMADESGVTFFRLGTGPTSTTGEDGSLSSNQARFSNTVTSTEIAHEYTLATEATLDAGQLRFNSLHTSPHSPTQEATTTVGAFSVQTRVVVAESLVTTPKWRVASSLPDYVLKPGYSLMPLEEVEAFARKNHRLPNFQSAEEMSEKGIDVADMNIRLLKTVEELTLHLVALKKDMEGQKAEVERLKRELQAKQAGKAGGK